MVPIRALFLTLSLLSLTWASSVKEFSFYTGHSPQVSTFYHTLIEDLKFNYYCSYVSPSNESRSLTASNTSTTSNISYSFSPTIRTWGNWEFSPLFLSAFSHKRLKYQRALTGYGEFLSYEYCDMRKTNLTLGLSPDFTRALATLPGASRTPHLSFRPTVRVVKQFLYGVLDRTDFTSGELGGEIQVSFLKKRGDYRKGFLFKISTLYEQVIAGDRHISTTYGHVLKRENHYPKKALHIGLSIGYTVRLNPEKREK